MKCKRFNFENLRNEEAFQFYTEVKVLTQKIGAEALDIKDLFATFEQQYTVLELAIEHVRKSAITELIHNADQERDSLYRGFVHVLKSAELHFEESKREAAYNVKIVVDHYGNIAQKGVDDQTASLKNLLSELERTRQEEIAVLELSDWMSNLHEKNTKVEELVRKRDREMGAQEVICVKDIRMQITQTYRDLLTRIDSLMLIKGVENYKVYVEDLDVITDRYKNRIAQRKGRNHQDNT